MSSSDRSSWDPEAQKKQVPARPQGRNFLLLIGIDIYAHFPRLENAIRDTQAFRDLLQRKYQFEPDHTIELFDEDATRRNILQKLKQYAKSLTANDSLLIYHAGHGYFDESLNLGYFIPSEGEKGDDSTFVSNTDVRDRIRAIQAHHIFLITDSCFSGSLLRSVSENRYEQIVDQNPSRWVFASGRMEKVEDGVVGRHSPFAKYLLTYLRKNKKPRLSASELINDVKKATANNSDQTPVDGILLKAEDLGGEFVFDLKLDENRDWIDAEAANTMPSYQAYLLAWPEGQHIEAAHWRIACLTDTATAYDRYLERYPRGKWAKEADEKLREAEARTDWEKAQIRDSLSAYRDFLRRHPEGKYADQARQRQAELRKRDEEPAAWKRAQHLDTQAAYETYLRNFPNGAYVEDARSAITAMEAERNRQEQKQAEKQRQAEEKVKSEAAEKTAKEQRSKEQVEQKRKEAATQKAEKKRSEEVAQRISNAKQYINQDNRFKAKKELEIAHKMANQAEKALIATLLIKVENENQFQEAFLIAERSYSAGNFLKTLEYTKKALQYPSRFESKALELQARCQAELPSPWQRFWENKTAQLASVGLLAALLIWGIVSLIPGDKIYQNLLTKGKYQLDSLGDRQAALSLFEQAAQEQSTEEIRLLIETTTKELNRAYADSLISRISNTWNIDTARTILKHALDLKPQLVDDTRIRHMIERAESDKMTHPADQIPIPEVKYIKGGTFQMGSNDYDSEKPIHSVTVSDFELGETEVTFEQYDAYCEATGKAKPDDEEWGRGQRPVINVSWQDAQAYCQWLSDQTGQIWRLPTEAEWEYAARGGQQAKETKYAGSNDVDEVAWYGGNAGNKTHPVAQKRSNELGLYDMSGNVFEWVEDQWNANYEGAPTDGTAWMDGRMDGKKAAGRVIRGGSWSYAAQGCRVSYRGYSSPGFRRYLVGFRLVVSSQSGG